MNEENIRLEIKIKLVIAAAVIIYMIVKVGGVTEKKYYCTWTGCYNRTSTKASFCIEHRRYINDLLYNNNSERTSKSSRVGTAVSSTSGSSQKSSVSSTRRDSYKDSYNDGYDDIYLNEDYDQERYDRDLLYANSVHDAMEDMG